MSKKGLDEAQEKIQTVLDQVTEKYNMTAAEVIGLLEMIKLSTFEAIDD